MKAKNSITPAETAVPQVVVTAVEDEEQPNFATISASLAEIRKLKGVIGYILRDDSSAAIDLDDSEKIFEFATLSSVVYDSCLQMAKQCKLGDVESMLVEGEKVKVLCMGIGENKISVFMEKSATHAGIIKRILL